MNDNKVKGYNRNKSVKTKIEKKITPIDDDGAKVQELSAKWAHNSNLVHVKVYCTR